MVGHPAVHDVSARKMRLRVVHVVGAANGAAWVHEQLRELRARGHVVSAVIPNADGTLADRLRADDIPFHLADLDIFGTGSMIGAARRVLGLARLLRRLRPDVVQYHVFASIITGRLAAWLADVPVRFSMIPGPYYLEAPGLSGVDVLTATFDTRVIASCEYTRTLYQQRGIAREHVELIYYGQDADRFVPERADGNVVRRELGISSNTRVVGDVAYFYAPMPDGPFTPPHLVHRGIKGHDVLLEAAAMVLAEATDTVFLLVGSGWGPDGETYRQQLQARAVELGIAHAVRFTGSRSDIPDTLAALDVSVQCSLNENLGGSIESLLMARPLVASSVGGLVDAVIHERTGLLVPPSNASALAAAILRLLRDRQLAMALGEEGRRHALARFTLESTADHLDALYQRETIHRRDNGYALWRLLWRLGRLGLYVPALVAPLRQSQTAYSSRTGFVAPSLPQRLLVRLKRFLPGKRTASK